MPAKVLPQVIDASNPNAEKANAGNCTVTNRSRQLITIQAKPPGGDFYRDERQIRLQPGKSITLPKRYLNQSQIENSRARGFIDVIDS